MAVYGEIEAITGVIVVLDILRMSRFEDPIKTGVCHLTLMCLLQNVQKMVRLK